MIQGVMMKYYILLSAVLSCILILFFSCEHERRDSYMAMYCADSLLSASDAVWSHEEGDLQNTKRATLIRNHGCVTGPTTQPSVQWAFQLGGPGTAAAPVIGDDGTIYIAGEYPGEPTGGGLRNSGLMAISPSGSMKWFFSVHQDIGNATRAGYASSAAVGRDGALYFVGWDSTFYALKPDGTVKWKRSQIYPSADCCAPLWAPAIGDNGNIYAGSDTIMCLRPDGHVVWRFYADTLGFCQRIILGKNLIFCSFQGEGVLALDYSGHEKWFYSTYILNPARAGIIADEDDNIYFKTNSSNLVSISSTGQVRWRNGGGLSEPALRGDYLYFLYSASLYRLDKNTGTGDTVLTTTSLDFTDTTSPLIDDNGTIYIVSRFFPSLSVMAISKEGMQLWSLTLSQNSKSGSWGPLGLGRDGTLYVPTEDEYPEDPPAVSSLFAIK
jgi:outer membrane protein assembly factor BamB